jgi:D-alanine-D-alanine ligase-like ATP-grasp enzyme
MKNVKRQLKKESLVLGKLLRKIAPRIGATVFLEPEWKIAGQIIFKSGKNSYFRYNALDINPVGASDIAKDKDYANLFMRRLGYPIVPDSETFFSKEWAEAIGASRRTIDDAYAYSKRLGFPVVVKPNTGSQGSGVAIVHNRREFYRAMRAALKLDRVVLVQRPVHGRDYRLVVLNDEVISAYERTPLNIVGDGKISIQRLLQIKQHQFIAAKRGTRIKVDDPRIAEKLKWQGLTLRSVPSLGEQVFLLDNANLSSGGDAIDVTISVNSAFRKLAVRLTSDMNLRLCGIDLMVDGSISEPPIADKYWVLEINAAPGLDHYAKSGKTQEKIVEELYLKVLRSLDR